MIDGMSSYFIPQVIYLLSNTGDGAVFSQELLVQGKEGGREAAFRLSKAILSRIDDVPSEPTVRSPALGDDPAHGVSPHRILAMVYVNASGLATTLVSNGVCSYQQFSEFFFGFNQASPLFTMVDVGPGKEAADAKLRGSSPCIFTQISNLNCHRVYAAVCSHPTDSQSVLWRRS